MRRKLLAVVDILKTSVENGGGMRGWGTAARMCQKKATLLQPHALDPNLIWVYQLTPPDRNIRLKRHLPEVVYTMYVCALATCTVCMSWKTPYKSARSRWEVGMWWL